MPVDIPGSQEVFELPIPVRFFDIRGWVGLVFFHFILVQMMQMLPTFVLDKQL